MANVSVAQDSTAFYTMSSDDISICNAQNLEDVLAYLPLFHQFHFNNRGVTSSGVLEMKDIAVYKDDIPLMMDQNIRLDLRTIPVWDLEKIAIFIAPISTISKSSSVIVVRLYSKEFEKKPYALNASLTNTSSGEFHSNMSLGLSNLIHSGMINLNRSFTPAYYSKEGDRATMMSAAERYDLNLKYQFKILPSVILSVSSDNSLLRSQKKGKIITGTTRVQDVSQYYRKHSLYGSISSALSKKHTLTLKGLVHRLRDEINVWDKDLSNSKEELVKEGEIPFSVGYDFGYMQLAVESANRDFNYKFGIELSSTIDNEYSSIDAIATEYSDYTIFGMFDYQFKKSFRLDGGVKLLTNRLTSNYLLPHARVVLAPNSEIQLSASVQKTISYPMFNELFYPGEFNDGVQSNILLEPISISSANFQLDVQKGKTTIQSGVLYVSKSKIPKVSTVSSFVNKGRSAGTMTYARLKYMGENFHIGPSIVIHGLNGSKDSLSLTYFYPELNLNGELKVPVVNVDLGATARLIGKRSYAHLKEGDIFIEEQDNIKLVTFSIKKSFLGKRMSVRFGVTNILDSGGLLARRYRLGEVRSVLEESYPIVAAPGRSYVFKISYGMK